MALQDDQNTKAAKRAAAHAANLANTLVPAAAHVLVNTDPVPAPVANPATASYPSPPF